MTCSPGARHAMVLGCGRSGTSIFGELFETLPGYTYQSEPSFDAVLAADFSRPQAFKVPRESEGFPPRPGLSFPLERFLVLAPEAAIFWIVRHPLDTICSLRVGIARNWGHHPRPPDWREWLQTPLLHRCAHHWAFFNTEGFAQVQDRCYVLRFEDMLSDPAGFATRVCARVGVDPAPASDRLAGWIRRVQDTNNEAFVEARTSRAYSRADHAQRMGRWRENLSPDEVAQVGSLVAHAAAQFGYELPTLAAHPPAARPSDWPPPPRR